MISRFGKVFPIFLFLISVFMLGFLPVRDPDFGWHYRCGKELIELDQPCTQNRFSYFLTDYEAYNPSFLYDTVLAVSYDAFGFMGVTVLGAAILALCGLLFVLTFPKKPLWMPMLGFYGIFTLSGAVLSLGLRSQILTYLFTLFLLYLLSLVDRGKQKALYAIPFLMLVWVNTHIGFFVGLLVLFCWFLMRLLRSFTWEIKIPALVVIASCAATLLNPFGWKVYLEIWNHAFAPLSTIIAEWVPPPLPMQALIIGLSLFGVVISVVSKSKKSLFSLLLLLLFGAFAFKARRNTLFFFTAFFYHLISHGGSLVQKIWSELKLPDTRISIVSRVCSVLFLGVVVILTAQNDAKAPGFDNSWDKYCHNSQFNYPCEFIEQVDDPEANIFATYEWGGLLIWKWPKSKVFIDGRMPAWKDEHNTSPYKTWLYIIQTRAGWDKRLDKYGTDYLLISNGVFLDLLLQKEADDFGWEELYRDKHAAFFKRKK